MFRGVGSNIVTGFFTNSGGDVMGEKGSKDKGTKEPKKKAEHTIKEKRKLKQEKKNKG